VKIVAMLCRLLLAGAFLWAGIAKARDPVGFLWEIEGYGLVWGGAAAALALYLPWLEILAGSALLVRRHHRGALIAVSALLGVFLVALVQAWGRGLDVRCGCFGGSGATGQYAWWIGRDLVLLGACAFSWDGT
jgi:uncharacterized membrane protein YphA (DoxX/SURF4 family)